MMFHLVSIGILELSRLWRRRESALLKASYTAAHSICNKSIHENLRRRAARSSKFLIHDSPIAPPRVRIPLKLSMFATLFDRCFDARLVLTPNHATSTS